MKLIIYKKPDGSVIVNKPLQGRITLGLAQCKFINANCADKIPTHMEGAIEAVDTVSELTVSQRICLDGKVITTQVGTIDGTEIPVGTIVRRFNAEKAGISYDELEYEIVDSSAFDDDRIFRDAWRFAKAKASKRAINIPAAKEIGHEIRVFKTASELKKITGGSPMVALTPEGEAKKQEIEAADAAMNAAINDATTPAGIKKAVGV